MKVFLRFFKYTKNYIRPLILANAMMLLYVLFSLLSITLIMPFIDLLFNQGSQKVQLPKHFSVFDIKDYLTYQLSVLTSQYTKLELVTYLCITMIVFNYLDVVYNSRDQYSLFLLGKVA